MVFSDRRDAGRRLAERLRRYAGEDPVVVALPRGGVPVAVQVAAALAAPMDILAVRKLGAPGHPELAVGVGDARATEAASGGKLTLGQLAPAERKRVRPALAGSAEQLLHETGLPAFLLARLRDSSAGAALQTPRLHRAIGVIYRPETERRSHDLQASPSHRFDALVHIDHTRAVEPLERTAAWDRREPPETYPTAL